jgi:hypothetical protein
VRVAGERYASVAATIETTAYNLARIAEVNGTTSKAVDAIRTNASEVAEQVGTAKDRYAAVGEALVTYAAHLAQAQADSLAALHAAQSAQAAIDSATGDVRRASGELEDAAPEDQAAAQAALDNARRAVRQGDAALARARADLEDAVSLRDRAAQNAVDAIHHATSADGLNDGWWDNWGSKVFHAISDIAGFIAMVAGVAALFLAWVPILGEALAAIALIATAVALVADIVLLIAGEGSWLKVGLDVLSLVTFGAGRVAGAGLRAGAEGAQGTARLAAGSAAALSPAQRLAQGLSGAHNAATAIGEMTGPTIGGLTRITARGLAGGTRTVTTLRELPGLLALAKPSAIVRGVVQDLAALRGLDLPEAIALGRASVGGAQGVPATVSAILGHPEAATALSTLTGVTPALSTASTRYATAVNAANITFGVTGAVTGADAGQNAYGVFDWVTGLGDPSSAQILHLN